MKIRLQDVKHNCISRPLLLLKMLAIALAYLVMYILFALFAVGSLCMTIEEKLEKVQGRYVDGRWKEYFLRRWRRPPAKNG